MTLQQLEYFLAIAREQHITRAAEKIYASQSTLSRAIQELEYELKVPLFLRSGRKVELTSYGLAFMPFAQGAIDQLRLGRETIRTMSDPQSGVVNVSYAYINGFSIGPEVFNSFKTAHPDLDITIQFNISHVCRMTEDELSMGRTDLVFTNGLVGASVTGVPITKQELFIMLPVGHPLAKRSSLRLEDVEDEPLIAYGNGRFLSKWIEQMYQYSNIKPNYSESCPEWTAQLLQVELGQGMAILPRVAVNTDRIAVVPIDHPMNKRDIYLLWASNRDLPPAVKVVRDYCLDYYQKKAGA